MLTILNFDSLIEAVIFYAITIVVVSIPAYYYYKKALKTRKTYKCKECGEIYKTEHMESTCCKVCGAQVDEI